MVGASHDMYSPLQEFLQKPDLRTVPGEARDPDWVRDSGSETSLGDVDQLAGADLTDPDVKWAVTVRDKDRELSVRRNRRVDLFAVEVGDTLGSRIGQRILPEIVPLPQLPRDAGRDQKDGRCNSRDEAPAARAPLQPGLVGAADAISAFARAKRRRSTTISRIDW